jgi:hypothetical protein
MAGNEAYRQWGVDPKNERSSLPHPGVLRFEGACLFPLSLQEFLLGALFLLLVDVAESEALFKFQRVGVVEGGGQDGCRELARTALELGDLFGRAAARTRLGKGITRTIGLFRFLTRQTAHTVFQRSH